MGWAPVDWGSGSELNEKVLVEWLKKYKERIEAKKEEQDIDNDKSASNTIDDK